jgi:hypothetical protein
VVESVQPYGAFVDIGGAVGLLHISQISSERLATVGQVRARPMLPRSLHEVAAVVSTSGCAQGGPGTLTTLLVADPCVLYPHLL